MVDAAQRLERGMRAQLARLHAALDSGVARVGWKICVNDAGAQARFGIDAPFVGHLRGDRLLHSGATYAQPDGAILVAEAEVALEIGADGTIRALRPAIELANYAGAVPALEHVAEHGSYHACAILGEARPPSALPRIGPACPRLLRNGERTGNADPSLVPTDLADVARHVAGRLAPFGESVEPGDLILAGSYVAPVRVGPGDAIRVEFDALGTVEARIASGS